MENSEINLWEHFEKLPDKEHHVKCRYCHKQLSYKGCSYKGMRSHLVTQHPNVTCGKIVCKSSRSCKGVLGIPFKLLTPSAVLPTRPTLESAGFDLIVPQNASIPADTKLAIDIEVAVAIPYGYCGRICSKTQLGTLEYSLVIIPSIIDSDYRGSISVFVHNSSNQSLQRWFNSTSYSIFITY